MFPRRRSAADEKVERPSEAQGAPRVERSASIKTWPPSCAFVTYICCRFCAASPLQRASQPRNLQRAQLRALECIVPQLCVERDHPRFRYRYQPSAGPKRTRGFCVPSFQRATAVELSPWLPQAFRPFLPTPSLSLCNLHCRPALSPSTAPRAFCFHHRLPRKQKEPPRHIPRRATGRLHTCLPRRLYPSTARTAEPLHSQRSARTSSCPDKLFALVCIHSRSLFQAPWTPAAQVRPFHKPAIYLPWVSYRIRVTRTHTLNRPSRHSASPWRGTIFR
jgi:hypothetical protein